MIYDDQFGYLLRLIFVYRGSLKKMKIARTKNLNLEKELNRQWGIYFILISVLFFIILYNI